MPIVVRTDSAAQSAKAAWMVASTGRPGPASIGTEVVGLTVVEALGIRAQSLSLVRFEAGQLAGEGSGIEVSLIVVTGAASFSAARYAASFADITSSDTGT